VTDDDDARDHDLDAAGLPDAAGSVAVPPVRGRSGTGSFLRELPVLVVVALGLALLIKAFLVQAFYIPSGSMEQTLAIHDRVLVNKLVYDIRDIHRGEVVVFNGEGSFSPDPDMETAVEPSSGVQQVLATVRSAVGLGSPGEKDFIKRVIGLPGDRVACCTDGHVTVQPEGGQPVELVEPYVYTNSPATSFCAQGDGEGACPAGSQPVTVPPGRLFVLGDHRDNSSDSRAHIDTDPDMGGTIPQDRVIGRAFVVVWPFPHAAMLRVPGVFSDQALGLGSAAAVGAPYALGLVGALPVTWLRRRRRRRTA